MDKKVINVTEVEIPNRRTFVNIRLYDKRYGDIPHKDYESPEIILVSIEINELMC
jgi:hypothetical protein